MKFLKNFKGYAIERLSHDVFAFGWATAIGWFFQWATKDPGCGVVAFIVALGMQGTDCVCNRCGRDGVPPSERV